MTLYVYKNNRPEIHESVFIAPTAQIIGNVSIGKDSSVWFQSVLRGDMDKITIGEGTNIQDMCTCHADEDIPLTIGSGKVKKTYENQEQINKTIENISAIYLKTAQSFSSNQIFYAIKD